MSRAAWSFGLLAVMSLGLAGPARAADAVCADFSARAVGEALPDGLVEADFRIVAGSGSKAETVAGPEGIAGVALTGLTGEVHPPQPAMVLQLSVWAPAGAQAAAFDDRGHFMKAEAVPAADGWTDFAIDMSAYMGRYKILFLRFSAPDGAAVVIRKACAS